MESSFLTAILLPLALFIIMLAMGLGLTVADFKHMLVEPKAVLLGLVAQLILLPLVGVGLASIFPLSPELAVGVMILAASPGGPTSNLLTYLAKGNIALSITLTAISSLITVFSIPIVVNLAMVTFMGNGAALQLPFGATVMQIAAITLIPVSLGMLLHNQAPKVAAMVEARVKWLSLGFLGLIILSLMAKERTNVEDFFFQAIGVVVVLMLLTMGLGYAIATLANLDRRSTAAITIEVGIQNGTLAIAIASATTFLNNPTMAIPAALYSVLMFVVSGVFAWWIQGQPVVANVGKSNKLGRDNRC
ncbi:bile acid:sodium symporter family protein [Leptolyngbyaceae cyanobacterium CCMR0082]|uniref:Bile acid:sodium symporter family protein n=1 Tax=Adonisia turfae CCMR0082 TaxID=2304604 RepID=A0A6M0S590_9CYAN|nr:bile acid:sodium symporter family protein [Adonisia turfae]NEZ63618.1 bile acid:sodium symporter family protein [Adonisia turfae CCMR0082]